MSLKCQPCTLYHAHDSNLDMRAVTELVEEIIRHIYVHLNYIQTLIKQQNKLYAYNTYTWTIIDL